MTYMRVICIYQMWQQAVLYFIIILRKKTIQLEESHSHFSSSVDDTPVDPYECSSLLKDRG